MSSPDGKSPQNTRIHSPCDGKNVTAALKPDGNSLETNTNGKSPAKSNRKFQTELLASSLVSFMDLLHHMTVSGAKVMQDVDSALCELGLVPLSLRQILENIGEQINKSNVAAMVQKLNADSNSNKVVLQVLSIFTQLQLTIVQSASESLSSLLNTEICGSMLADYQLSIKPALSRKPSRPLPQTKSTPHSFTAPSLPTTNTAVPPVARQRNKPPTDVHQQLVSSASSDRPLVSEEEIKDVIDLLSGVKALPLDKALSPAKQPPPTAPKPTLQQPYPGYTSQQHVYQVPSGPPVYIHPGISNHQGANLTHPGTSLTHPGTSLTHPGTSLAVVTGYNEPVGGSPYHRPLGPQVSDSVVPLKTNTWPMRPGRDGPPPPPLVPADHAGSGEVYEGFSSDLEFSQYVNAVAQRSRHRGQLANPWSVGAAAWSPLGLVYDRHEGRQWTEDSSNCSDETSSNGDWTNDTEAALGTESKSTKTWPPKHPWAPAETVGHLLPPGLTLTTAHKLPPGGRRPLHTDTRQPLMPRDRLVGSTHQRVAGPTPLGTNPGVAGTTPLGTNPPGTMWTGY